MAIAEVLCNDVFEEILVRLDVKDLIECKNVCKSWYSLISSHYFVKLQLNYSRNNDHLKLLPGYRRIARSITIQDSYEKYLLCGTVGSSNGLVCQIFYKQRLVVSNPLTPEFKVVPLPGYLYEYCFGFGFGFGYDPCIDDYKLIAAAVQSGTHPEEKPNVPTSFHVFTLNASSAAWRFIGQVNYGNTESGRSGVLCDGALHWFMTSCQNNRKVILSLNLSTEEFKEIPQPKLLDEYECNDHHRLGVVRGCLCIYNYQSHSSNKWFYNEQHFWKLFPCDTEIENVVHYIRNPRDHTAIDNEIRCHHIRFSTDWDFIRAPIFVQSLVSPHGNNNNNNIMGRPSLVSPHVGDAPTTKNKVRRRITRDGLKGVLLGWLGDYCNNHKQGRDYKESRGGVLACFSLNFLKEIFYLN